MLLLFIGIIFIAAAQMPTTYESVSKHYRVHSEISLAHAQETAQKMDAFFDLYNSYFHFDSGSLTTKLNVKIFNSKEGYDKYLSAIIGQTKNSFVYLQYSKAEKSELVGYAQNDEYFDVYLLRHGFIQFLKSFITNPPRWIQRGFAVYFENSSYDQENNFAVFRENLNWLNLLKEIIQNSIEYYEDEEKVLIPLPSFLNPDNYTSENQKEIFYAEAWGVITFLANSENNDYNRILWDSIRLLKKDASLEENEQILKKYILTWTNEHLLFSDYISFINSMKTFPELVRDGISFYSQEDFESAENTFIQALVLNANHELPYYYLGLIHYKRKDYSLAEYYYQSALMLGSDPALIYYALGLNAFADDRLNEAESYLIEASTASPEVYGEKTKDILERIKTLKVDNSSGE